MNKLINTQLQDDSMISPIRPWNTLFFYGRNLRCFLGRPGGEVDRYLDFLSEGVVVWETGKWLRNADRNPPWECCFTQNFLSPRFFAMFSFLLKKNTFLYQPLRENTRYIKLSLKDPNLSIVNPTCHCK